MCNRWVLALACMVLTGVIGGLKIARQDAPRESKDSRSIAPQAARIENQGLGETEGSKPAELRKTLKRLGIPGLGGQIQDDARSAVIERILGNDGLPVTERVTLVQQLRGHEFSKRERDRVMAFLDGTHRPQGIVSASAHWLADELLTTLRLQQPPWEGLAAALGDVASLPGTDPVIRDYIMQHLGHLWEQHGPREEIESALWQGVETSDETTPGTALIALRNGYGRDRQEESLAKVRRRALDFVRDPTTSMAVRATALAIAGESGAREVKELAAELAGNPDTPMILRKVAENVGKRP